MRLRVIEFVPPGVEAIARELALFDDDVLELDIVRTRSSTEQRDRMLSDDCDVALTAIDNLIEWNANGGDLRLVAQVERTTVLDFVADPGIRAISELGGATLAVDAVDSGFAIVLRKVLADHGVGPGDYELLSAGGINERCDAILSGRAAGGLLGPPWSTRAIDKGLARLTTIEAALPAFPGIGVVVRASRRSTIGDALSAYLDGLDAAVQWVAAHNRAAAIDVLVAAGFDAQGAAALIDVVPQDLEPSIEGVDLLYAMRRELGLLPGGAPDAAELCGGTREASK
jgi:ABC-type nitrate/sulfonate/bicarbonate transport system substrate-binding protein